MRALGRFVAAIAILVALWGVLGLVAWAAGVLPETTVGAPGDAVARDAGHAGPAERTRDAGAPRTSERDDIGPPPVRATDEPATEPVVTTEEPATEPVVTTDEPATAPLVLAPTAARPPGLGQRHTFVLGDPVLPHVQSLVAAQLVGDERPEIVVGLGDRFEVLEPGETDDGTPTLRRLATITQVSPDPAFVRSAPRAAIGDVTGDGRADLVIAFWRRAERGGSRGGGAWVMRGRADGALDRPVGFAGPRVMASSVSLLDLDGRGGLDVVLADRGRPFGGIPGRVRVYAGGRRPTPLGDHESPMELRMVLPAHADEDERVDLVAVGEEIVRFRNLGRGRFERMEGARGGVLFADVPHGWSGDLDGDGWLEAHVRSNVSNGTVIVERTGERHVPFAYDPRHDGDGRVHAIVGMGDTDADGRAEALVLHSVTNAWCLASFDASGAPRLLLPMHGGHPWHGYDGALVDLDLDGVLELVTLDSLYDAAARRSTYYVTIAPACTRCSPSRRDGVVEGDGAAAHDVR